MQFKYLMCNSIMYVRHVRYIVFSETHAFDRACLVGKISYLY